MYDNSERNYCIYMLGLFVCIPIRVLSSNGNNGWGRGSLDPRSLKRGFRVFPSPTFLAAWNRGYRGEGK